jgi:SAM-dependent methyltransferase
MTPSVASSGLHSVNPSNAAAARLYFLDAENVKPAMRAAKARSFDLLNLGVGSYVLDVGCGPGDDARTLSARVGPSGRVVGLDIDPMMLAEAARRAAASPHAVELKEGDVYALPEPDASFDACRAERTFLHLAEPARAIAEMIRVLKPGGRIAVLDRDIETRTIDAPDRATTRAILHFWCDSFFGGWVGRALPRLFRDAGLVDVAVESTTVIDTDYATFTAQYDLPRIAAQAHAAGVISAEAMTRWRSDLVEMAERGSFFSSMTCFIVSGRKPSR